MKPNLKSTRDSILSGGVALTAASLLSGAGLSDLQAVVGALVGTFLVARGYRALRKRWTWLNDFDPAAE